MKQLAKIGILFFGISLFFTNCQKDDLENEKGNRNISIKEYSLKELNENSKFKNSFNQVLNDIKNKKLLNKKNEQNRTFGFDIDSSTVKEITITNQVSYTFSVINENQEANSFKNLVVQVDSINNTKAFLITYFPDNSIDFNEPHNSFSFQGTKIVEEVSANSSKYQNRDAPENCTETFYCTWGGGLHFAGENCTAGYIFSTISCSGSGGGGSSSNNTNQDPIPFFTAPVITYSQQIINCLGTYILNNNNTTVQNWLNNSNTTNIDKKGIATFLDINNCSQEAQQEVVEKINSLTIEEQIDDTNLDNCSKNILANLKNLQQNDISKIINRFGDISSIYNWEIKTSTPIINSLNDAETNWKRDTSSNPIDYNYLTHLNPSYKNQATKIAIARTILHEMIHAYLISLVDDAILTGSNDVTNFPLLWNSLVNNTYNNNTNQLQHEIIGRRFIEPLRDALKEWDGAQQPDQYYEDLAWGALQNTSTFNVLFPTGSIGRNRIINTNQSEDTNSTQGGINPKGNSC